MRRFVLPGVFVVALFLAGCAGEALDANDSAGRFFAPRTAHLAPDGQRVIVADLGTGHDDGRVVAVDPRTGRSEVLMSALPSTRDSGQRFADLAGPSGAAMAPDGVVCAVIGDARQRGRGFNTLRCTDGLVVDLRAFEEANNPDGLEVASNPFDVAWDGREGWLVSDAAANTVLAVERSGRVTVAGVFAGSGIGDGPEGVPTGLSLVVSGRGERSLIVALFNRGHANILLGSDRAPVITSGPPGVIAALGDEKVPSLLVHGAGELVVTSLASSTITDLDRPTGVARLADGHYFVCEQFRARCRVVE